MRSFDALSCASDNAASPRDFADAAMLESHDEAIVPAVSLAGAVVPAVAPPAGGGGGRALRRVVIIHLKRVISHRALRRERHRWST